MYDEYSILALARNALVRVADLSQLQASRSETVPRQVAAQYVFSTIQFTSLIFKRSIFESRRRPIGNLRPRVKVEFASLLLNNYPRTQTERCLAQMFPNGASQLLAIMEALGLAPGSRRSLVRPSLPADENDWEINDVYTELLMAAMELIYRKYLVI
ncbi:hypothetical protein P879_02967 [Paragonimus westermani]|uniref:Uncharacterized protein n=1 Tax=Paragonimus westermani TaxID=34504 RepID=A0A8T0DEF7_9TREM|nr:hypothetical protein P879_02967 [Paragonimus westermani]